ncbi:hypothetical protein SAMN02745121_05691 [Nannocystis exedens]|uniref:Uncharacterized protein n=1 Tax=Nannocystis exedens TaxID=54 RepID=A0A1I2DRC2_9BACT|nr:hypothetical protein [Nannocystis exedens]PCC68976.1 hypothetical protein NAEX_01998 [Nannocystis exedens]SFE82853.1 hypothetical protein SAMN02745121_05691 [Nannocystis exedens]
MSMHLTPPHRSAALPAGGAAGSTPALDLDPPAAAGDVDGGLPVPVREIARPCRTAGPRRPGAARAGDADVGGPGDAESARTRGPGDPLRGRHAAPRGGREGGRSA